jgi:hypothetical protein
MLTKFCKLCNNTFETKSKKTTFCSNSCAAKYGNILKFGIKNLIIPKECEKCGIIPEVVYGSNRFCSSRCARSFSTSEKRREISRKTSDSLIKRFLIEKASKNKKVKVCKFCHIEFEINKQNKHRNCCTAECVSKLLSLKAHERSMKGNFDYSFGRRIIYVENGRNIHCDSLIEWCAVKHLFEYFGEDKIEISRSTIRIHYKDPKNGKSRYYNPDFEVNFENGKKIIVECKSEQSGTSKVWKKYHQDSLLKKQLLQEFCESQGFEHLWFNQNSRKDLYRIIRKKN